ncbi:bacterio-opsin activator domain-containing protein [Haloprofundus halophilus]|uniref:bacterio-opsin activator domain-containing protein n=1 Tax=Haloprofundus halophilus TaxID=2283527 RepID=UPI000E446239|nr:bacterio-opsin activator domain-containing protein [Haloprofundus halophilus]
MTDRLLVGRSASGATRQQGARILLAVSRDENRSLLAETLDSDHEIVDARPEDVPPEEVDLCILDPQALARDGEALGALKDRAGPLHLPFLLVVPERNLNGGDVWRQITAQFPPGVDDLIRTPVSKAELRGRLQSLLRVRRQSASLGEQRERLDRLNRVNSVIREANAALVGAKSRDEVEERVCTRLSNAGPYCYVRICEPRATRDALTVSTKVGDLVDPPDPQPTTNGDRSQATAAWRSFTDRKTLSTGLNPGDGTEFDDETAAAWREWADSGSVRGFACVPIRYRDTVYGVLEVYTRETDAFDEEEQSVLDELGQTIGHTINAVESKRLLLTNGATEIELRIADADDALLGLAAAADAELRLEGVTGSDPSVEYFTVLDGDGDDVVERAADSSAVVRQRIVREGDDGTLVQLAFETESVAEALTDLGTTVDTLVVDERGATAVALLPRDGDVGSCMRGLRERYDDVQLRSRRQVERRPLTDEDFVTAVESDLTDRQRNVLKAAYLAGYFDQPRESSGKDVATSLGISSATFHQHIRAGEMKLVSKLFDKITVGSTT